MTIFFFFNCEHIRKINQIITSFKKKRKYEKKLHENEKGFEGGKREKRIIFFLAFLIFVLSVYRMYQIM